jgi:ankyrin repeat protein
MKADVSLDHLGHQGVHSSTACGNVVQYLGAFRLLVDRSFDGLNLASNSPHSIEQFLFLFGRVCHALLDHGADIEANGACIGGGTPLADAVAFGQWKAARRLVERGTLANLWQAAGLGLMDRLKVHFASGVTPSPDDITNAFWCACHGGQRAAAEYLLGRGAEINWVGYDKLTPLDAANRGDAKELAEWLTNQGAKSASSI